MRVPQYERRRFRIRGWMIAVVVILLVLLFSLRSLAGFYTDYLWFDSLGQGSTWGRLLSAKVVPALVFTIAFFLIMLVNLVIADRLAPRLRMGPLTPEDEMVARYRTATERYTGRIRVGVSVFFALIAGLGVSSQWKEWMLFTHRVDFGETDPQFHKDIGFYVFQLPFIRFIIDWLFAGLVIVLLVTAVAYYLNGGIRFQSATQRVSPHVKAHLSVILAAMALVKTAEYYFGRFELNFSTGGAVDGAGYTQVKAELPALNLLIFISIVAAALFLWNIWRRGWVLPIIAVGLWGFVSIVVGTIYPAMVQQFRVKPNEYAKERPYIARNIRATRDAYKLSRIDEQAFNFESPLTQKAARDHQTTIDNARLWDPEVLAATYSQVQESQTYYNVDDVDIDRYTVANETVQTAISLREVNGNALPTQSWINEHIIYTHGYGVIASPTNRAFGTEPEYFAKDIPVTNQGIEVDPRGAQIYFGEQQGGYVIVDAKQPSLNYPRQGVRDSLSRYRGKDGVQLSSVLRKASFALRFSDINLLISGQIRPESKILLYRSIRSRVEKLAPFLKYDNDPYPVVIDGRVLWVVDAYTTSGKYPYSQYIEGINGLAGRFNYVRNSVKATVDAYDGTVKFYVVDPNDPVIESWQQSFPDLFTKFRDMPNALKDHLRYPEDIFRVQAEQYAKYHVVGTRRFFQGSERWLISPDPNDAITANTTLAAPATSSRGAGGRSPEIKATSKRQDPYYLYIQLPGDDAESFLMIQSFVPVSEDNQQLRLVSFLTAKSDRDNYGEMQSFVMPQDIGAVEGPVQAALQINQNEEISSRFTLIDQQGSRIIKGTVQLIPVGSSILYVQPIYLEGEGARFPLFQFVAVFTQDRTPVLAPTVNDALNLLFGEAPGTGTEEEPGGTVTPPTGTGDVASLLSQINQKLIEADAALRNGNLGQYQDLINQVKALAQQALSTSSSASTSTTTTPRSGSGSGSNASG